MHDPPVTASDRNGRQDTSLDPRTALAIAIGGTCGAILRFAIVESFADTDGWPWAVFMANIVGCATLGWLVAHRAHVSDRIFAASALGFCGALTTFSAFAVDLAVMARSDRLGLFAAYLSASFACGVTGYLAGRRIGRPDEQLAASP